MVRKKKRSIIGYNPGGNISKGSLINKIIGTTSITTTASNMIGMAWTQTENRNYCPKHGRVEQYPYTSTNIPTQIIKSVVWDGRTFCEKCISEFFSKTIGEIKQIPDHIPNEQIDRYIETDKEKNE